MKKVTLMAALMIGGSAFSQKLKISEVNISSGTGTLGQQNGSLANFQQLAPSSSILTKDFSQFKPYNDFYFHGPGQMNTSQSSFYSLQLGLQCAKMPKVTFRAGITHISNVGALSSQGSYSETAAYDTLTSSQTGAITVIDTSHIKNYNMNYSNQQIRLDGAMIFRMFPENRWSLHAGLGASIGMSYQATTEINYFEYSTASQNGTGSGSNIQENERFKNKNSLGASLYIPMGVDFGIGKKRSFWMPFHLYMEARPSLNINSINEIGTTFSPGMSTALGLRIKI
jgi:hypothetical protein